MNGHADEDAAWLTHHCTTKACTVSRLAPGSKPLPPCDPDLYRSNKNACATPTRVVRIHAWLAGAAFVFLLPLGE
jgi:hypothetical protein